MLATWLVLLVPTARAQMLPADNTEDSLPLTNDPTDPIGIERDAWEPRAAAVSGTTAQPSARKAQQPSLGPEPDTLASHAGEVVTGPMSVREHSHRVLVELGSGLARVHTELSFENAGEKPAEVIYRLAVARDAAPTGLEVCNVRGCRTAVPVENGARLNAYDDAVQARGPARGAGLPAADARIVQDERGRALLLRAAPVTHEQPLRIRIDYVVAAPSHAGAVHLALPARGMDARAAPSSVRVLGSAHEHWRVNELPVAADQPLEIDAWSSVEIAATEISAGPRVEYWRTTCGKLTCLRAYATTPREERPALDIMLALDASPSTEGAARSRMLSAISALLSQAPSGSRVRAVRFAAQALALLREAKPARDLTLNAFAQVAFEAELGAATRFEAAWQLSESLGFSERKGPKLLVIVGDGGLTTGPARPFETAKRKGVTVAVVNVGDHATSEALQSGAHTTGGAVLEVGTEAELAARAGKLEPLEERIAAVYQPSRGSLRIAGLPWRRELRAGDSVSWEGALPSASKLLWGERGYAAAPAPSVVAAAVAAHSSQAQLRPPVFVAVDHADLGHRSDRPAGQDEPYRRGAACDRRGPAQRVSGLSSDAAPVQLAAERALCAIAPTAPKTSAKDTDTEGAGMPGSPLLSMLRQRILPVARGCFRRDRAGRSDYQVRAVFEFELAEREVVAARIRGTIAEPLRACLLEAVDSLAVPRFSGKVLVRYPLSTEREPLPSQIELTSLTAGEVDRILAHP